MNAIQTKCLVIGSGIAGLSCALELGQKGFAVIVASASNVFSEANSSYAQGGIIYKAVEQNEEALFEDILAAGSGINYKPAVEQLVKLGPKYVEEILLDKCQVPFDRGNDGLRLTREGGHRQNRILYRGDESGRSIQECLLKECKKYSNIQFLNSMTAVNLLMTSHHSKDRSRRHEPARCFGAFMFSQQGKEVFPIFAEQTVIATGGIGQLYLYNTNSRYARGDGLALGYRAGCRIENLEYIQFHPTTFYHPRSRRFLISEAVRGEGGVLVNHRGESFLAQYLPQYPHPELAPRDKVAQAIHQEMLSSGQPCVYLDISKKEGSWIQERFPFIYRTCLEYGIDITREPIPVVPAAHYHCGGVWADLKGKTTVENLWAVGEVSCTGLHGANRLASTSLLEGLVWGTECGKSISNIFEKNDPIVFPEIEPWKQAGASVDPAFLRQDWQTLKQTMWNYVGLIKTNARLQRAEGILRELYRGIDIFYQNAILSDELIGLRHAALASLLVLESCKKNPKSLGCYQREELEI